MVHVLGVGVLVADAPVRVLVRVHDAWIPAAMNVLVVPVVVPVRVRVRLGRVLVRVLVTLGEMEPHAPRNRGAANEREPTTDRLPEGDRRDGADEWAHGEHAPGPGGTERALREEVELEAPAVAVPRSPGARE